MRLKIWWTQKKASVILLLLQKLTGIAKAPKSNWTASKKQVEEIKKDRRIEWEEIESFCYGELGLSTEQYCRLTYREYLLKAEGYNRQQSAINNRFRMQVYLSVKPYLKDQDLTVYDFMPLPDDPTQEEIEKAESERLEEAGAEARKVRDQILSKHKQRNGGI